MKKIIIVIVCVLVIATVNIMLFDSGLTKELHDTDLPAGQIIVYDNNIVDSDMICGTIVWHGIR